MLEFVDYFPTALSKSSIRLDPLALRFLCIWMTMSLYAKTSHGWITPIITISENFILLYSSLLLSGTTDSTFLVTGCMSSTTASNWNLVSARENICSGHVNVGKLLLKFLLFTMLVFCNLHIVSQLLHFTHVYTLYDCTHSLLCAPCSHPHAPSWRSFF